MTNQIKTHPALQLKDFKGEQYRGDLVLIRTTPQGTRGLLKTFSPDIIDDRGMQAAYDSLVKTRNDWMRNGHPEYFNSHYEIMGRDMWVRGERSAQ